MDSLSGISIGHRLHYSEKLLQASKTGRASPTEDSSYNLAHPPLRPSLYATSAGGGVCIRFCSMIFIGQGGASCRRHADSVEENSQ